MGLEQFCHWLGNTATGTALRESLWVFPILETIHVLAIALLCGTAAIFDLRLLGLLLQGESVRSVQRRVMPLAWAGAVVLLGSGALLFWAGAEKLYANPAFRVKLLLLVIAGVNPLLFHFGVYRRIADWDLDAIAPPAARRAAWTSLAVWSGVIIAGRAIAYL
ncbi:DUF6644 family protein [Bryobacter aggregatus]|uniref:DUF6644 family protein n=1 Tax=Bryobacter aggregatus TaxID=360054 RepID=UPI0004E26C4C|nr:DUF6644 family protein [Bryobacter aggregatus]